MVRKDGEKKEKKKDREESGNRENTGVEDIIETRAGLGTQRAIEGSKMTLVGQHNIQLRSTHWHQELPCVAFPYLHLQQAQQWSRPTLSPRTPHTVRRRARPSRGLCVPADVRTRSVLCHARLGQKRDREGGESACVREGRERERERERERVQYLA